MKLVGFKYKPFSIRFKSPFINSSGNIASRKGFILCISGEMGRVTLGEVSPLPGFSIESAADAEKELSGIAELVPGFEEARNPAILKTFVEEIRFTPSVRFGIEEAMTSMLMKKDRSLFKEFFTKTKPVINVNAAIGITDDAMDIIRNKIQKGYSVIKIKIGRKNFEDDLDLIKKVCAKAGNSIKIRLDANGKWTLEEAKSNLEKLKLYDIEYIEEPCHGIENLIALSGISPLPVAADESVKNFAEAAHIIEETNIPFLVIKPMVFGGFFQTAELIMLGALKNKNIIISSAFETPVGKSMLTLLASMTHHSYAHGLDTADLFEKDLFEDPYKVESGKIPFSAADYPPQFDYEAL